MKVNSIALVLFIMTSLFLSLFSCEKNNKCKDSNISSSGSMESHNFGQNCMECHKQGGKGEGCFNVAGSVYDSTQTTNLTIGSVRLYTQPNGGGTLKYTIAIDAKGNFHTTEAGDYSGLYPAVVGHNGSVKYMGSSLSSGACNSCHGVTTSKLWAN